MLMFIHTLYLFIYMVFLTPQLKYLLYNLTLFCTGCKCFPSLFYCWLSATLWLLLWRSNRFSRKSTTSFFLRDILLVRTGMTRRAHGGQCTESAVRPMRAPGCTTAGRRATGRLLGLRFVVREQGSTLLNPAVGSLGGERPLKPLPAPAPGNVATSSHRLRGVPGR